MTFYNKSLSALLALLLILPLSANLAAREVQVGVHQNPPKIFFNEQGNADGLLVELLQEIGKREMWQLHFTACYWPECLEQLRNGKIDLLPDVAWTVERGEQFDFHGTAALNLWSQIYRHPEAEIHSILDLDGKRVAVLSDSVQEKGLYRLINGFEIRVILVSVKSFDEAFAAVAKKSADAVIANHLYGGYRRHDFGLVETPIVLMPERVYYATKAGENRELSLKIEHYLSGWINLADSPYYQIVRRWGGSQPETLTPEFVKYLFVTLLLLGGLLGAGVLLLRKIVNDRTRQLSNLNDHLQQLAHYDPLTGLPNRALIIKKIQLRMEEAQKSGEMIAIAHIDLDEFKLVNDRFGIEGGNQLIIQLSKQLLNQMQPHDLIGRIGGDEFVAVLTGLTTRADCEMRLQELSKLITTPTYIDSLEMKLSGSIGLTIYPQATAVEPEQLLRQADQAMYQAKLYGKNRFAIFDDDHDRFLRGMQKTIDQVQDGIAAGEFELYYQPKVEMRQRRVIGVEALIRWHHPVHGFLEPAAFLPLLEKQPVDIELGYWVLTTAIHQAAAWRQEGRKLPVSANVSAWHLLQPDFLSVLFAILDSCPHFVHGDIELEVLESTYIDDISRTAKVIERCNERGVQVSLDDFGTGFSSLAHLRHLPAYLLKIDKSFVIHMLEQSADLAIVEAVIRLAALFDRGVIAEGVESEAHIEKLLELDCLYGQGYGIARPMPAAQIPAWIERYERR